VNHAHRRDRWGATTIAALLIGATSGCTETIDRPKTVPVQGKVTYKGEAVPKGSITFQPDQGQPSVADIQPDGTYRLSTFGQGDGAVPGHYRVFVIANTADPTKMPGSSPGWTPPKDLVPPKYNKAETSGLETTVNEDKKEYNFDLQ
jgi:hypothetical protein